MKIITSAFSLIILASSAQGAVVYFANRNIPIPSTFTGVFIDIETGNSFTSSAGDATADVNFFFGGEGVSNDFQPSSASITPTLQFLRIDDDSTIDNLEAVINLSADGSQVVGPTPTIGTFTTGFAGSGATDDHLGTGPGQFEDGVLGHLGFSVQVGGNTHYGYFEVILTNNGAGVVQGWAYDNTPDTPITVIPIPEPATGLLAIFSLGLLCVRRRR